MWVRLQSNNVGVGCKYVQTSTPGPFLFGCQRDTQRRPFTCLQQGIGPATSQSPCLVPPGILGRSQHREGGESVCCWTGSCGRFNGDPKTRRFLLVSLYTKMKRAQEAQTPVGTVLVSICVIVKPLLFLRLVGTVMEPLIFAPIRVPIEGPHGSGADPGAFLARRGLQWRQTGVWAGNRPLGKPTTSPVNRWPPK